MSEVMKLVSDLSLYETPGHEMESLQWVWIPLILYGLVQCFQKCVLGDRSPTTGIMLK